MESVRLEVKDRQNVGTSVCRRMRNEGKVPVNLYGQGRTPRAMIANAQEVAKFVDKGVHIVELLQEDKDQVVLVQDVQFDALGSQVMHVDFLRIDRNKPVHVYVPVSYIGMAPEVSGSIIEKLIEDIQVECLPLEIPDAFIINLSVIEVGSGVKISELEMPAGAKAIGHNPNDLVVLNHIKKTTEEPEEGAEGDESVEPEVIGKSSTDEEDE